LFVVQKRTSTTEKGGARKSTKLSLLVCLAAPTFNNQPCQIKKLEAAQVAVLAEALVVVQKGEKENDLQVNDSVILRIRRIETEIEKEIDEIAIEIETETETDEIIATEKETESETDTETEIIEEEEAVVAAEAETETTTEIEMRRIHKNQPQYNLELLLHKMASVRSLS
jgi:hypothetical protein